jgi:mannose-6-phosphate isomerase-like protein (cupin superfamily)
LFVRGCGIRALRSPNREVGRWAVNRSSSKKARTSGKRARRRGFAEGLVYWRTLISGDVTRSEALTMGIGRMPPGEALRRHRHRQAEVYLVLEGTGSVEIGAEARPVEAGSAVFIPGDVFHSLANTGTSDLRFAYVFPADSFGEVEYVFDE